MCPSGTLRPMNRMRAAVCACLSIMLLAFSGASLSAQDESAAFLWRYSTGGKIRAKPAVTEDGTVYALSEDRHLYAFEERTGKPIWRAFLKDRVWGGLSIGPDGTVFAALKTGKLVAVNPQGGIAWEYTAFGIPVGDPAVSSDGTIFFALDTGELHAVAHNGRSRWVVPLKAPPATGPAIGADGDVYIGCANRQVYAYRPWGELLWNAVLAGVPTGPALTDGNILLYGTDYGSLVAISKTGEILWDWVTGSPVNSPVVSGDRVYAVSSAGELVATNLAGEVRWKTSLATPVNSSPIITAANDLLVISADNQMAIINDDGALVEQRHVPFASGAFVISTRGVMVFARSDWLVYAYQVSRPNPLGWTQARGNPQHTGSIAAPRFKAGLLPEFRGEAEFRILESLARPEFEESKRIALAILKSQIAEKGEVSPFADHFLSALASEGTLNVTRRHGRIINDFPQLRSEAVELLAAIGDLHTVDLLAILLTHEHHTAAQLVLARAIGTLKSDSSGRATAAISKLVLDDLHGRDSPDPRIAMEALDALKALYAYRGIMPDPSGYDAIIEIYRGAYPMYVREKAVSVLRSYRE